MNVHDLQKRLNKTIKPSPNLRVDGVYGPRTEKAVRLFQASVGLGVDGIAGPRTQKALETGMVVKPAPISNRILTIPDAPWMAIAGKEIGQREIPGKLHNPRIIDYHSSTTLKASYDETPWCSSFVNWVLEKADFEGTKSAAAISWANWGKSCSVRAGAIAVIYNARAANSKLSASGNHVGFVVQESARHFLLLGGNQSDQVKISAFPRSSWHLRSCRWPEKTVREAE